MGEGDRSGRRGLAIGLEPAVFGRVERALAPLALNLTAEPNAQHARALATGTEYALLVAAYPTREMPTAELLDGIRQRRSASHRAGLVLLAPAELRRDAQFYVGQGANRVVAYEEIEAQLCATAERLLSVAPRVPVVVPCRIEVRDHGFTRRLLCQTANLSSTGMLLRVPHGYPPETELGFELFLAGDTQRVRGRAVVVRQTRQPRELFAGVGVTFTGFDEDAADRLSWHVKLLSMQSFRRQPRPRAGAGGEAPPPATDN